MPGARAPAGRMDPGDAASAVPSGCRGFRLRRRRRIEALPRRQVVDARLGAQFLQRPVAGVLLDQFGEAYGLTLRVGDRVFHLVAEVDRPHRAGVGARRQLALLHQARTEDALLRGALPVAEVPLDVVGLGQFLRRVRGLHPVEAARAIGAGRNAEAAADAARGVLHDDPVLPLPGGADRTDLDAGCIVALHARPGEPVGSRGFVVAHLVDPDPLLAGWDEVHRRAGAGALAAAVAAGQVDHHDPAAGGFPPFDAGPTF